MSVKQDVGMGIKMTTPSFPQIVELSQGKTIDESAIVSLCDYVDSRHDCADFRLIVLTFTVLSYRPLLTNETVVRIEQTMKTFKYWMDEPGEDGMCYWSENHQLLFSVCEYFAGELFPDAVFTNDQTNGSAHHNRAEKRIVNWLNHRFRYGFIEWHSNTYYEEDIAPLCVLIDHCKNPFIQKGAVIIMDLLMLDFAHHLYQGRFVSSSGRCYEKQKQDSSLADVNDILAHAFGPINREPDYSRLSSLFLLCQNYRVPDVIQAIAKQDTLKPLKESTGLHLTEVKHEFPALDQEEYGMFLWAMEAFTNRESIAMTMQLFSNWKLESNTFLKDLKMINIGVLKKLHLLPLLVRILNPATQGVAIQRANVYTWKTKDYCLTTAQRYHPGEFGDQQHLYQATLPNHINVFGTHPGSPMFDDSARNFSPSFWVGNGVNPDVFQQENVICILHNSGVRKGFLERKRLHLYHFYVPKSKFDETFQTPRAFYGRIQESYLAILSSHEHNHFDDEIQILGKQSAHVMIVSSKEEVGSFEAFINRYPETMLTYQNQRLQWASTHQIDFRYRKHLLVNGMKQDVEYPRFDSPFVKSFRKPQEIVITYQNKKLHLSMDTSTREERIES